jgi:hypothetical protein
MILKAFAFHDRKIGVYGQPFFMAHIGQAIRAAIELGEDRNTIIGRHPADYQLIQIGEYNDATGEFVNLPHNILGTVVSFLPSVQPLIQPAVQAAQ